MLLGFINIVCQPLAALAGSAYPVYRSFRALEAADGSDDRNVLLCYWICFGLLTLLELLLGFLVTRLPLFYLAKLCLVIWLQAPHTQGAERLYRRCILPLLKRHQASIDNYIEEGRRHLGDQLHRLPFLVGGVAGAGTARAAATSAEGLAARATTNVGRTE